VSTPNFEQPDGQWRPAVSEEGYAPAQYPPVRYPQASYPPTADYPPQPPGYPPQAPGYPAPGWLAQPPAAPVVQQRARTGREVAIAAVAAAAIAVLGLGLGLIWSGVAPWVPAVRLSDGAILSQPEQEQMIADEGWYLLITILAGVAVAVLAWVLLRRHRGVAVLLGVTVGSVAAGLLAFWLGHHLGLSHARYLADHAAVGTTFSIPPNLRAQQVGLWHGWLPYAKGDVLSMAIAAVVTYILLAGFSPHPALGPAPATRDEAENPATPVSSGW
jgi:hypothetical protein